MDGLGSLQDLDIERNNLGPAGATGKAVPLTHLSLFRRLRLGHNNILDSGGKTIATSIRLAFKDSLLTKSCLDPAHLAQCVPNVEIAMIPQSITDAVDPADVSEMCLKHVITGNMPQSLAITFEIA